MRDIAFAAPDQNIRLIPANQGSALTDKPLEWSLELWGEGKEEFNADDWHKYYKKVLTSRYEKWDTTGDDQELLFLALKAKDEVDEVVAAIGLSDFDDLEEYRHLKPWLCAFVVKPELRGSGIGTLVLSRMEDIARSYGVHTVHLWTEDQSGFYIKRGYRQIDQLIKPGRLLHILRKQL